MKKTRIAALMCILILLFSQTTYAQSVTVSVNGESLAPESYLRGGITYVPLTALVDAIGGWDTGWDPVSRRASADTGLFVLSVPIGADFVYADGFLFGLNGECFIENGRTYVPLRAVANLLGARVTFAGSDSPILVTTNHAPPYTDEDLYWLSRIISAESQGESLYGQIAVGNVVLNRVASAEFPNTIKAVIFDTKDAVQFEPTANGTVYHDPTPQSVLAARLALNGTDAVADCMYFFNPSLSEGVWIRENRAYYTTIGCHNFYR